MYLLTGRNLGRSSGQNRPRVVHLTMPLRLRTQCCYDPITMTSITDTRMVGPQPYLLFSKRYMIWMARGPRVSRTTGGLPKLSYNTIARQSRGTGNCPLFGKY